MCILIYLLSFELHMALKSFIDRLCCYLVAGDLALGSVLFGFVGAYLPQASGKKKDMKTSSFWFL